MRRYHHLLLSAWLLACSTAPLAAIEYHAQGAPAEGDVVIDPLDVAQSSTDDSIASDDPAMLDCGCDSCGASCCDSCDKCGDCCGCYPMRSWVVRADALWMQRSDPNDAIILTGGGGFSLDADQLQFDFEPGFDVSIMEIGPDGHAWELRGMWLDDFTTEQGFTVTAPVLQTAPTTSLATGSNDVDVQFNSELWSCELNRLYCTGYGTLLIGARYFELDEQNQIDTAQLGVTPPPPALLTRTTFATRNDLTGLQLGYGATVFEHNCWQVQALAKAGVYYNDVNGNVTFLDSTGVSNFGIDESDELAFSGEVRLTALYQLPHGWGVRLGYEALAFDGVALATEQVGSTANVVTNDPIPTRVNLGTVIFHGAFLGLEYSF